MNDSRTRLVLALAGVIAIVAIGVLLISSDDDEPSTNDAAASSKSTKRIPDGLDVEELVSKADKIPPIYDTADGDKLRSVDLPDDLALAGNLKEARIAASVVNDNYNELTEAVSNGAAFSGIPVRDTIAKANNDPNLAAACDLMIEKGQQETIFYVKRSAGLPDVKWNCENATAVLLRRVLQTGALKLAMNAEVVGASTKGNIATVTVRFGGKNGRVTAVPLVKQNDQWMLAGNPPGASGKPPPKL